MFDAWNAATKLACRIEKRFKTCNCTCVPDDWIGNVPSEPTNLSKVDPSEQPDTRKHWQMEKEKRKKEKEEKLANYSIWNSN
jgi:hypothetical protein